MPNKKKQLKYEKEQQEILDKLLEILNYNNDYTFYLYDLDNKIELQESIYFIISSQNEEYNTKT